MTELIKINFCRSYSLNQKPEKNQRIHFKCCLQNKQENVVFFKLYIIMYCDYCNY